VFSGRCSGNRLAPPGDSLQERVLFASISLFVGLGLHSVWRLVWLIAVGATDMRLGFAMFDLLLPLLVAAAARLPHPGPHDDSRPSL
jgi:hypothetical protein